MLSRTTAYLLLIAIAAVAYLNALGNGFVWDDEFLVQANSYIRNHTYLAKAFTTELHHGEYAGNFYRPLLTLSFMADYFFWGLNPLGYHLTNILLHLLCALLVYELAARLAPNPPRVLPLIIAAVFLAHPINVEAVTYVSGRSDPLMLAFLLGSLLLWIMAPRAADSRLRLAARIGSWLCFAGALFSRETAMIVPLLVLWYAFLFLRGAPSSNNRPAATRGSHRGEWWLAVVPFFLIEMAFLAWRTHVLSAAGSEILHPIFPLSQKIIYSLRALAGYIGLIFFPARLQMERQVIFGGWTLSAMTLLGALVVYGWIFAMTISRRRWPLIHFGLGWFAIALLPVSGLFDVNATMAEHWLYLPSIGLYLALACAAHEFLLHRALQGDTQRIARVLGVAASVAVLLLAVRTSFRNGDWVDSLTFYQRTLQDAPLSTRIQNNLVNHIIRKGDYQTAIAQLEDALQKTTIPSIRLGILGNLGLAYTDAKNYDKALDYLQQAIALKPTRPNPYFYLAGLYQKLNRPADTEAAFRLAEQTCPQSLAVHTALGLFLAEQGHFHEAHQAFQRALDLEPGNAAMLNLLGYTFYLEKKFPEARDTFLRAVALDRHSPDALFNLGLLYREQGDTALAEQTLRRAVVRAPRDPQTHFRLALLYWQLKQWGNADAAIRDVRQLTPQSRLVQFAAQQIAQRQELTAALAVRPELKEEGLSPRLPTNELAPPKP